ncbi:MAG: iron-sulfur cluster assembly protein, partial [Candidatus Obscuribacterales bacterium]|nr:iron-sulfur cluster assembly protein [Candidatus Obscuribacterales bacterium]
MFGNKNKGLKPEDILNALRQVEDPDLHQDIVTLGMVSDIKID